MLVCKVSVLVCSDCMYCVVGVCVSWAGKAVWMWFVVSCVLSLCLCMERATFAWGLSCSSSLCICHVSDVMK